MKLISIHPAVLLVNYKSCRRRIVLGASVFRTVFSSFLPAHRSEADSKGAFDTLFGALRYWRRDRTRASASIWHRRWIFIRTRADIRSGVLAWKRKFRATCVHKGLPGRGRVHRPEFMLQNCIDAGHVHVATRHSATKCWYFRLGFIGDDKRYSNLYCIKKVRS